MTKEYAIELLSVNAEKMISSIEDVMAHETDGIMLHKLLEVLHDCVWARNAYGKSLEARNRSKRNNVICLTKPGESPQDRKEQT